MGHWHFNDDLFVSFLLLRLYALNFYCINVEHGSLFFGHLYSYMYKGQVLSLIYVTTLLFQICGYLNQVIRFSCVKGFIFNVAKFLDF